MHQAGLDLQLTLDDMAKGYIREAMVKAGQRKGEEANLLDFVNHQTLCKWQRRMHLN